MDGVNAYEKRDSQTTFFRKFLKRNGFLCGHTMQEGADFSPSNLVRQILVAEILVRGVDILIWRTLSWRHIARSDILAHLPDLLLQGHFLQKRLCPLRSRQRRVPPVSFSAGSKTCQQKEKDRKSLHIISHFSLGSLCALKLADIGGSRNTLFSISPELSRTQVVKPRCPAVNSNTLAPLGLRSL